VAQKSVRKTLIPDRGRKHTNTLRSGEG